MRRMEKMDSIDRTKTAVILLAVIACVVVTAGWASAEQASGLAAVGAVDPANGYPKWYMDGNGLQLGQCLDTTAADPCGLLAAGAIPTPTKPILFPTNFPDEFFYWRLTGKLTGLGAGGAGTATLVQALEGAFGGATGTAADGAGAQIVFARFRLRVKNSLHPGATYTMTGPLGSRAFVADATGTINFTDDRGCLATPPACDFTLALNQPNVGPFLRWDATAPAPPAGFIGDPAILHGITGSPFGNNFFRIDGPDVGGPGVNTIQTNLFSLTGKIFVRASTTTTLASSNNAPAAGQAVTLTATVRPVAPATGVPTGTVTFRDGATVIGTATLGATGTASISASFTAGTHSLTAAYGGSLDFLASTSAVLTLTVGGAAPPPGATDTVSVNRAEQVVSTGELRVEGVNSRIPGGGFAASVSVFTGSPVSGSCPGTLIATAGVSAADGRWAFRGVTSLRPTSVCVKSAGGGVGTRAVTRK